VGVLAGGMVWAQYRLLVFQHAVELYGLLVAVLFAVLGIWLGMRLSQPARVDEQAAPPLVEVAAHVPEIVPPETTAAASAAGLSPREVEVLRLVCKGHSNAEIAAELFVSPNTVKTHVSNLLFKLDAKRRTQAAERARALGLV